VLDLQVVDLALEPGDLLRKLFGSFLERSVALPEPFGRDAALHVKPVEPVHLRSDA
jgi:hypothetical protein